MSERELLYLILGMLGLALLGLADLFYELTHPGEDLIDVATVGLASVLSYRIGKASS